MNIKINIIEAASELADKELNEQYSEYFIIYEEDEEETRYTEEAQDKFNELYDKYFNILYNMQEPVNFAIG